MTILEVVIWVAMITPIVGMGVEHLQIEKVNHDYWKRRQLEN